MAFPTTSTTSSLDVPIGSYVLFPSTSANIVEVGKKKYLKSGVLAPSEMFPEAPAENLGDLTPIQIGFGNRYRSIAIDDMGFPWILCCHTGQNSVTNIWDSATIVKIVGLSSTSTTDVLTFEHATGSLNNPGQDAFKIHFWKEALITTASDTWGGQGGYNSGFNYYTLYRNIGYSGTGAPGALGEPASTKNIRAIASNSTTLVGIQRNFDDSATTAAFSSVGLGACNARTLPSALWTGVAWSATPAVFVAVASGGTVAVSSTDGATWTTRTLPASANWSAICASTTRFVAIASGSTNAAYSDNGTTTWNSSTLPASASWSAINFGNSLFLAVARDSNIAATSSDGITWTQRTLPYTADWCDVAWSPSLGVWIAIAEDGGAPPCYSSDGITWYSKEMPRFMRFERLYSTGADTMVAFGYQPGGGVWAKTTDAGRTWKYYKKYMATTGFYNSPTGNTVEWVNNRFVAAYVNNTGGLYVYHSTDAINWTSATISTAATPFGINGIGYTNGNYLFALAGWSGVAATTNLLASTDLVTATTKTLPNSAGWKGPFSVTGNKLLMQGNDGAQVYWAYSTDSNTWTSTGTILNSSAYFPDVVYSSINNLTIASSYAPNPAFSYLVTFGSRNDGANLYNLSEPLWLPEVIKTRGIKCGSNYVVYQRAGGNTVNVYAEDGKILIHSYTSAYNFATNDRDYSGFYAKTVLMNGEYYLLSSNSPTIYRINTGKSVLNYRSGTEGSGALVYYMRVE